MRKGSLDANSEVRMPKSTSRKSTTTSNATPRLIRTRTPRTTEATSTPSSLTHDDIALRAYEIFLRDGAPHGRELEHWLRAEAELREGTPHPTLTLVG
jgi:Protein of unknown function (DUF2934)